MCGTLGNGGSSSGTADQFFQALFTSESLVVHAAGVLFPNEALAFYLGRKPFSRIWPQLCHMSAPKLIREARNFILAFQPL